VTCFAPGIMAMPEIRGQLLLGRLMRASAQ